MRRIAVLLSVVVALMGSMLVSISAHDTATPPTGPMEFPDSFELAPGVVADNMVFAEGAESPALYRLTFDPGVVYPVAPSPNLEVVHMESGSLVLTLDAAVTVTQLGDTESGGEMIPANTEFTLETGQFLVLQPGVSGEVRNDGTDPASASVAGLTPAGAQVPIGSPAATPEG